MKLNLLVCLFLLSVVLYLLDFFGLLSSVKKPLEEIVIPVKKIVYNTEKTISNAGYFLMHYPSLRQKMEDFDNLKKKNEELNLKMQLVTGENNTFRKQLGAPLPASYQFIPGQVLGITRFMEIAVGTKDKVEKGMIVVDGDVFIGKVVSVSNRRCLVMLPTDIDLTVPVKTSRGAKGIVTGLAGQTIILDKVLQKDPLFLDDLVITSGEENTPPNLLIGKVAHIITSDVAVYKQAKVTPLIDYQNEQTVFVIGGL